MRDWYHSSKERILRRIMRIICVVVLLTSLFMLGRYAYEAITVNRQQRSMSQTYHAAQSAQPVSADVNQTDAPLSGEMTAAPVLTETAASAAVPTVTPVPLTQAAAPSDGAQVSDELPVIVYPHNPNAIYSVAFSELRKQNTDIMAWLQVQELVDTPVVLRNNTYYLDRDAFRKSNSNGAIFLDECTSFTRNRRPYTFIVYGHNMKSGAMFGSLKKFTKDKWYYNHPFLTFNTLYEDGQYVIFSVATVNVENSDSLSYVSIFDLYSESASKRLSCMKRLRSLSAYYNRVSLQGDDQVLLLVTCNGNDAERLIISARRIRDGQTKAALQKLVP